MYNKNKSLQLLLLMLIIPFCNLMAQRAISIYNNTLTVPAYGEQLFHYGFAKGDKLVFNFKELNGEKLKDIEIIEVANGASKCKIQGVKSINDTVITLANAGVYKIRIGNDDYSDKTCTVKIKRIPLSSDTKRFNSNVFWRTVQDSTYTKESEYYLQVDTIITNHVQKIVKVTAQSKLETNRARIKFDLPSNTVAWAYYIGVDKEGEDIYQNAVAKTNTLKLPNYNPVAAVAFELEPSLTKITTGEDINYFIADNKNADSFDQGEAFLEIKRGQVMNDFKRMATPVGGYSICLSNDNKTKDVDVFVKISSVAITQNGASRLIKKLHVEPKEQAYLKN